MAAEFHTYAVTLDKLIAELMQLRDEDHVPGDAVVVMSKDTEGNEFRVYADADDGFFIPEGGWYGERWEHDPDEDEDDTPPSGAYRAVFLWPVN